MPRRKTKGEEEITIFVPKDLKAKWKKILTGKNTMTGRLLSYIRFDVDYHRQSGGKLFDMEVKEDLGEKVPASECTSFLQYVRANAKHLEFLDNLESLVAGKMPRPGDLIQIAHALDDDDLAVLRLLMPQQTNVHVQTYDPNQIV